MKPKLFLNADDFGMNKYVNREIKKAILEGDIRSVSVMTTGKEFEDAVAFLKKHKGVKVGLHFDLTEDQGLFSTAMNLLFKPKTISNVKKDLIDQYNKLESRGITISHIDSHEHIHAYPPIFKLVALFARKHNIKRIRHAEPRWSQIKQLLSFQYKLKKYFILTLYYIDFLLYKNLLDDRSMVHIADYDWARKPSPSSFNRLIANLDDGTVEKICHLGIKTV